MTLTPGIRLGPYEIHAALGAGGMSACGYAEPRTCGSEARRRRQSTTGVGPRRRCKYDDPEPMPLPKLFAVRPI
jgi:hypothetical protein